MATERGLDRILADAAKHPRLFVWEGQPSETALRRVVARLRVAPPDDLVQLWHSTGGGTVFETEELLCPTVLTDNDPCLGLVPRNTFHQDRSMPEGLLVFHEGSWLSAVRSTPPRYVVLTEPGYVVAEEYSSLDGWYGALRREFDARYGLGPSEPAVEREDAADEGAVHPE